MNSVSLGWEIGNRNDGRELYTDAQYRTVARLLAHYLPQGLSQSAVVSHAAIAPGRKTDPLGWDWGRMWREYDRLGDPLAGVQWPTPELAVPAPAPPRVPLEGLHLEPIPVPDRAPITVERGGWLDAYRWAREVAENIGAEVFARRASGTERLVADALERLMPSVARLLPPWLFALVWPLVERAAYRVGQGR